MEAAMIPDEPTTADTGDTTDDEQSAQSPGGDEAVTQPDTGDTVVADSQAPDTAPDTGDTPDDTSPSAAPVEDLRALTVPELRDRLRAANFTLGPGLRKDDLIAMLEGTYVPPEEEGLAPVGGGANTVPGGRYIDQSGRWINAAGEVLD